MRSILSALMLCSAVALHAKPTVTVSQASFNPSLHQTVTYTFTTDESGTLSAAILDRDTYVVKQLARDQHVAAGSTTLTWDGRDEAGSIVPDEAWSLHLSFRSPRGSWSYFPAEESAAMVSVRPDVYDRQTGVLRYILERPSRVHLQAGIADRSSKDPRAGAVFKTIVNRAPRPDGSVIEQWTGMDESNTIYVPSLPNFVVSIAATPLPENAVISYGNRAAGFLTVATRRTGTPLRHHHEMSHSHHQGLTALDDIAPELTARPRGAIWRAEDKTWTTTARRVPVTLALAGITTARFKNQPARLSVYLDERKVIDMVPNLERPLMIDLPPGDAQHVVAVNWSSDYGPVAASAFRIQNIAR